MKKKYILVGIGIILLFSALFWARSRYIEQKIHPISLDAAGKSPLVKRIKIIQQNGARPRFSPDGKLIVFDRKNEDGFYDVLICDLEGKIIRDLTIAKSDISPRAVLPQRNNGNAIFHPSGNYIVFISEEESHAFKFAKWAGDPGLGTFSNLWATTFDGSQFWQLTDIPIKKNIFDKTPSIATVNPHFSHNGARLVWTERYADQGGHFKQYSWGKWQIKMADFVVDGDKPKLTNVKTILRAEDVCQTCNYATSMGFFPGDEKLLVSGNLDGQHEYGMDQYIFDLEDGKLTNLQNSPEIWEEDASISPDKRQVVYMSNAASRHKLDFEDPSWATQPRERDYWIMDTEGQNKKRLTYFNDSSFNDSSAPEYLGRRIIVAASDFSPDGRFLAGTLGVDFGNEKKASIELKIVLIEFESP